MKNEILNFLQTHWPEISVLVYEIIARLIPTSKNLSLLDLVLKLTGKTLELTQKGVDKVVPNNQKNTLKSFLVFALLSLSIGANAQLNLRAKTLFLTDNVAAKDTLANASDGQLYFNDATQTLRLHKNGSWTTLSSGTIAGLTNAVNGLNVMGTNAELGGPLIRNTSISGAFSLDFATNNVNMRSGIFRIANPANTFYYNFIGGAITGNRSISFPNVSANRTLMLLTSGVTSAIPYQSGTAGEYNSTASFTFNGSSFSTPNVVSAGRITATSTGTLPGINTGSVAGDPVSLVNGDLWYNSATNNLRARINGASYSWLTNTAAVNEIVKSDGTNITPTGIFSTSLGNNLIIGSSAISGGKEISVESSSANEALTIKSKGSSAVFIQNGSAPVGSGITVSDNGVTNPIVGIGNTSTSSSTYAGFTVSRNYAATNTVTNVATFAARTTGTAANGIGTGLEFYDEDGGGQVYKSVELQTTLTDVTNGSEDADFLIKTGSAGGSPTEKFRVTSTGISNNSGGLKHARVTTGSISATSSALVTITWGTAFADANYTVTASVTEATTSNVSMSVVHVESVSASAVTVRVYNASAGALTGTVNVIAIHD